MGCCNKKRNPIIIDPFVSLSTNNTMMQPILPNDSGIFRNSSNLSNNSSHLYNKRPSNTNTKKMKLSDFEILKLLGKGTFGKVLLVKSKSPNDNNYYAMKILQKKEVKKRKQEEHTKSERDLMVKLSSPFILNIKFAFQDKDNLYLVSDFMQGGELSFHINRLKFFNEEQCRFYAMEIILGIEAIHNINGVYRDLKPENILLDKEGHIKLTDFGLSKILDKSGKAYTICGTMKYVAPDVFLNKGYGKEVDWWSLGCVMYFMLEGNPPFGNPKRENLDMNIYKKDLEFNKTKSESAKNIIRQLLNTTPEKRLGYGVNGNQNVKRHPFFKGIDWKKASRKEYKPKIVPVLEDNMDLKYFKKTYTNQNVSINQFKDDTNNSNEGDNYFNFTYTNQDYTG